MQTNFVPGPTSDINQTELSALPPSVPNAENKNKHWHENGACETEAKKMQNSEKGNSRVVRWAPVGRIYNVFKG